MLLAFLLAGLVLVTILTFTNYKRAQQKIEVSLKPNCLLTRHPLVFLSGQKSLFYFSKYWNSIPDILREHGYEVIELDLPWRNSKSRQNNLKKRLKEYENNKTQIHVFGDSTCKNDLKWLESQNSPSIASIHMIESSLPRSTEVSPEDLNPRLGQIIKHTWPPLGASSKKSLKSQNVQNYLHSLWIEKDLSFCPHILGIPGLSSLENTQEFYLDIAISLAEYDLQCSH